MLKILRKPKDMLISLDDILKILDVNVSINTNLTVPLISLNLIYILTAGKQQEYFLAANPKEVYTTLRELKKRKLIDEQRFDELESYVKSLETELAKKPAYAYHK